MEKKNFTLIVQNLISNRGHYLTHSNSVMSKTMGIFFRSFGVSLMLDTVIGC